MAASSVTVRQMLDVLRMFVVDAELRADLAKALYRRVNGNKSVMVTLKMLKEAAEAEAKGAVDVEQRGE